MATLQHGNLLTDYGGFDFIIDLISRVLPQTNDSLKMVFSGWIDANMCAPLGAAIATAKTRGVKSIIEFQTPGAKRIMQKNGFLRLFGEDAIPDSHGTTISYREFTTTDSGAEEFKKHVAESFLSGVKGFPDMTSALLKEFRKSIFEIFSNAMEHAESDLGVFTCGQFYPKKKRLDFSIADLGLGIRKRILESCHRDLGPTKSIEWAVSGHTTRTGSKPGGLGLTLLREFIKFNDGRLFIVSDAGYWQQKGAKITKGVFTRPFPGTVVTIEINAADTASYRLTSEIDANSIF